MLFDLGDYFMDGFVGPDSATNDVNTLPWANAYTTYKATKDAWFKGVNEYFGSGMMVNPFSSREAIYTAYTDVYTKYTEFKNNEALEFWGAMLSLNPAVTDESSFHLYWGDGFSELHYTVFSPNIYNAYKEKMKSLLLSLKNLTIVIDGSTYTDFV